MNKDNIIKVITKNYGSIPHMSTSKMTQQADKKISIEQEQLLTKKARDWRDLVIVTEKLDGSNVGIVKKDGELIPVTQSGYHVLDSPFEHHHIFNTYVSANRKKFSWLPEGWRVCGEWLIRAHGTKYDITNESPFCAFDIIDKQGSRMGYIDFMKICVKFKIPMVPLLHIGQPISIKNAIGLLGGGHYGNPRKPEGVVYRMERWQRVDFLAKWVRADKEDGKYLGDCQIMNTGYSENKLLESGD